MFFKKFHYYAPFSIYAIDYVQGVATGNALLHTNATEPLKWCSNKPGCFSEQRKDNIYIIYLSN